MLLCGSFQNQVIRLINMFRFDEKLLSRAQNAPPEKRLDLESESNMLFELEDHEDMEPSSIHEDGEEDKDENDVGNSLKEAEPVVKRRDWKRYREIYERSKQYIFVAATLPENGKRTAGGELKRLFPDATWVSGHYLHRHNPRCVLNISVRNIVSVCIFCMHLHGIDDFRTLFLSSFVCLFMRLFASFSSYRNILQYQYERLSYKCEIIKMFLCLGCHQCNSKFVFQQIQLICI